MILVPPRLGDVAGLTIMRRASTWITPLQSGLRRSGGQVGSSRRAFASVSSDKVDSAGGDKRGLASITDIAKLCKEHGFIYPGSEIYNGLNGSFDYGPVGVLLKNNLRNRWWKDFIVSRPDCVGLDSSIILNPQVWHTAGHAANFCDVLVECKECNARHRADKMIEAEQRKRVEQGSSSIEDVPVDGLSLEEIEARISHLGLSCTDCGASSLSQPRLFNLMLETNVGFSGKSYLRPETAQGIFINFHNVVRSTRSRLPLGIGQVGKSFRNEISPSNFLFRTREFEQMELEYFCRSEESQRWFDYWLDYCHQWLLDVGLRSESVRRKSYGEGELAHYASATTDLEFRFPFGWDELWGVAHRSDYDLKKHSEGANVNLQYTDPTDHKVTYFPHVVEPAIGLDRLFLAVLCDAYDEETLTAANGKKSVRNVLRFHPEMAPYRFAVLPVVASKPEIVEAAHQVHTKLASAGHSVTLQTTGSIGRRYRRQDALGTPSCVTIDRETLENGSVTIRDRDTMEQKRVDITDLL